MNLDGILVVAPDSQSQAVFSEWQDFVDTVQEKTRTLVFYLSQSRACLGSPISQVDLILLFLKKGQGRDSFRKLKNSYPNSKIIVIAAFPSVEDAVAAMREGAADYLSCARLVSEIESGRLSQSHWKHSSKAFDQKSQCLHHEWKKLETAIAGVLKKTPGVTHLEEPLKAIILPLPRVQEKALPVASFEKEKVNDFPAEIPKRPASVTPLELGEENSSQILPSPYLPASHLAWQSKSPLKESFLASDQEKTKDRAAARAERLVLFPKKEVPALMGCLPDTCSEELKNSISSMIYVDDVTGLYNSRFLSWVLDEEIRKNQQQGIPFCVLFIDADHFKKLNDRHGHLAGTQLLYLLGSHLKSCIGTKGCVIRYGGDEFIVILQACSQDEALRLAESIRSSLLVKEFLVKPGVFTQLSVCIGIAEFPTHAETKQSIIEAADSAMYLAKKNLGKNTIRIQETGEKGYPPRVSQESWSLKVQSEVSKEIGFV